MTRVTPLPRDLAKLTRSLGSITVAAPRNSQLLNGGANTAAALLRKELEHGIADVPASERTLTTTHRPAATPLPSSTRTIPLMQSFHTTQRPAARADPSTIDFAFLPVLDGPATDNDAFAFAAAGAGALRMPLLPDNAATSPRAPALFAPEAVDAPLKAPEIVVMAADPAAVNVVSALTEVEGMGPDGVELRFGFGRGGAQEDDGRDGGEEFAGGMLTGLWKGLVDDVLGAQKGKVAM